MGIKHGTFLEVEQRLVSSAKLRIVDEYSITCIVSYTSPQGRNHYSKHLIFGEDEIRTALQKLDRRKAYFATEEYRRKNERSKLTKSLRFDVMKRNNFRCRICGRSASDGTTLEVDHIVPISKGGITIYSNLQTLCKDCNRGKSDKV